MYGAAMIIIYTVPGFYLKMKDADNVIVYADETVTSYYANSSYRNSFNIPANVVDFSQSQLTVIPSATFEYMPSLREILLPQTITEIKSSAISGCSALEIVDCSKCTSVPTLGGTFTGAANLQIKVPAALYDQWIAATNWSSMASYIVPV